MRIYKALGVGRPLGSMNAPAPAVSSGGSMSSGSSLPTGTIAISLYPALVEYGVGSAISGSMSPANAAVQAGLSTSATLAPTSWINATVSGTSWSVSIAAATAGTYYIWARLTNEAAVQAVSGAFAVVAGDISVAGPAEGYTESGVTITGTVTPAGDPVNVVLTTQNLTIPTSGWTPASVTDGTFTATLTGQNGGTYYVWAQDVTTGLTAVSGAIALGPAPGVTYSVTQPGAGATVTHGSGTIGLEGAVNPPQVVATRVALSTSNTSPPTAGWQTASLTYGNALWACYYPTPETPGTYYVWVETAGGTSPAVSSFSITVT